ncbi:MAG: cytosine permease [Verrucomicrobiota bacterium]|jgi:cytosine permease|nr:cytosine permease [Verrucomicrobiota bacterium]
MSNTSVPSYLEAAKPNPAANRAPWYKNTAPTYAGIFLWFVFWTGAVGLGAGNAGGILAAGLPTALLGIFAGAAICYLLFYHVFGRLGQKTGLPLYIVGSSTFGATGGLILPGFLMGLLQFGWVAVNIAGSTYALNGLLKLEPGSVGLYVIMLVWGVGGVVMALKGIQYVAMISTWLPIIPAVILLVLLGKTIGGLGSFDAAALVKAAQAGGVAQPAMGGVAIVFLLITYIVGFTATAGAAGVDFGTGARNKGDAVLGGVFGVLVSIFLTAGIAATIVAGFYGTEAGKTLLAANTVVLDPMGLLGLIFGSEKTGGIVAFLLALTAFPSCCFSSLIAANSIKTTLPKINPWISCGIGCVIAEILAMTGVALQLPVIFGFFGASFGPICGAMVAEYFLSKGRWSGPRAGFNPAGWIAWLVGFVIGAQPQLVAWGAPLGKPLPLSLILAFAAGAIVYTLLAKFQTPVLPYPQADAQSAD